MARADAILTAAQRIHEAALAPERWRSAMVAIAAAIESDQSFFVTVDKIGGTATIVAKDEALEDRLGGFIAASGAGRLPPWSYGLTLGRAVQSSAMMPDREFARTTFYNEAIRPLGAFYGLVTMPMGTSHHAAYITAGRHLGREDFSAEDIAAMQALTPHLMTALRVRDRLASADLHTAFAEAALDQLDVGVILVDAKARALLVNQAAEKLFANGSLRLDEDGVNASDTKATREWRWLVARCADGKASLIDGVSARAIRIRRGDGHLPLQMTVAPFRGRLIEIDRTLFKGCAPVAILLIVDCEREQTKGKARIRERFGLTAAEASLAFEIVKGDGRQAAADRLGVSLATARTHLQRIFEKTGACRQAELVNLLLRGDGNGVE